MNSSRLLPIFLAGSAFAFGQGPDSGETSAMMAITITVENTFGGQLFHLSSSPILTGTIDSRGTPVWNKAGDSCTGIPIEAARCAALLKEAREALAKSNMTLNVPSEAQFRRVNEYLKSAEFRTAVLDDLKKDLYAALQKDLNQDLYQRVVNLEKEIRAKNREIEDLKKRLPPNPPAKAKP